MTPERIRIDKQIYVSRTVAANIARISYSYLLNISRRGEFASIGKIKRDGREFFSLSEVRLWAKRRPWLTGIRPGRKPSGNRMVGVEITVPQDLLTAFRAQSDLSLSEFVRRAMKNAIRTVSQ